MILRKNITAVAVNYNLAAKLRKKDEKSE